MICVRCDTEKAESDMATKQDGRLRRWCKACEALRARRYRDARRVEMRSNVLRVSAQLGQVLAEMPI